MLYKASLLQNKYLDNNQMPRRKAITKSYGTNYDIDVIYK